MIVKPTTRKLKLLGLLFTALFASCSKDVLTPSDKSNANKLSVKENFYLKKFDQQFHSSLDSNFKWVPDWDNPIVQVVNDSVTYHHFPLMGYYNQQKQATMVKEMDTKSYLIVKNNKDFFKGIYLPTQKTGTEISIDNFTGTLQLDNLASNRSYRIEYENGKTSEAYNKKEIAASKKLSATKDATAYYMTNCYTETYGCTFFAACGAYPTVYYSDNCYAPATICGTPWVMTFSSKRLVCYEFWLPNPPIPGGGIPSDSKPITITTQEIPKTICDQNTLLASSAKFKEMASNLQKLTTDNKEHGYYYTNDSNGNPTAETKVEGLLNTGEINFTVPGKIDGILHSHYTGLLSIFSVTDLTLIAKAYKNNLMVDPNTFTLTVITAKGTQYRLNISDLTAFSTFADKILQSRDGLIDLAISYVRLGITYVANTDDNEKAFLSILKEQNTGLTLSKGNEKFDNWQAKQVDAYKNVVDGKCK